MPSLLDSIINYLKMESTGALMVSGDQGYVNEQVKEFSYNYNGCVAYSIPIFKYIPHGAFSKGTLDKQAKSLLKI